ncbi:MAG: hypothetical protein ACOZAK_04075 [Patescibacteria group bacterium]
MPRSRKIKVFIDDDFSSELDNANDQVSAKVRFDLYQRQQQIKEISQILKKLSAKGQTEQTEWLRENEEFVSELAENFVDESLFQLDGVKLDNKTLELSVQVMTELKETLSLFQTIVSGEDNLEA